ncbi:hypothetical protein D3C86_1947860 [compost metagenome]
MFSFSKLVAQVKVTSEPELAASNELRLTANGQVMINVAVLTVPHASVTVAV